MADKITIDIDSKAIEERLSKLPAKIQQQYLKKAYREAGEVMLEAVKANTPVRDNEEDAPDSTALPPGIMQEDMGMTITSSGVKVGPSEISGARARWINDGWHLVLHEKSVRDIPGKHFMERAFDEIAEEATDIFLDTLSELIDEDEDSGSGETTGFTGEAE